MLEIVADAFEGAVRVCGVASGFRPLRTGSIVGIGGSGDVELSGKVESAAEVGDLGDLGIVDEELATDFSRLRRM